MKKIRAAMVGGGIGGFIGEIHRMAMRLDNRYELVAGALSSDATRAMESAKIPMLKLQQLHCKRATTLYLINQ